ncbi:MAG TPA: hypothetical protein VD770_03825, partial [Coxiellaceae bacterium]|nr:hypothetical protein [Coxiellaceae bacterium]
LEVAQDYEEAFRWYYEAALEDNIFALYQIAHCYLDGRGTKRNLPKAYQFFARAANLGDADSAANLAEMLIFNLGTSEFIEEGLRWLDLALAQNNALAYYLKSRLCKDSDEERRKYLKLSAEAQWPPAQLEWAKELILNLNNTREALIWIKKSADSNKVPEALIIQASIDAAVDKELAAKTAIADLQRKSEKKATISNPHTFFKIPEAASAAIIPNSLLHKYKGVREDHLPTPEIALRRAASSGEIDDIKMFITYGININAQDINPLTRRTALHQAVLNDQIASAQILISAGGNVYITDAKGKTVLDYVKISKSKKMQALFNSVLELAADPTNQISRLHG